MWNVFQHKEPRTAQLVFCCLRDAEDSNGINVINVHAPSGKQPLTDKQRTQMLKNLLQSNFKAMQHSNIGERRGIIGGDMNTTPHTFNTIANKLKRENVLRSHFRYHYPSWAKHGDACNSEQRTMTHNTKCMENRCSPLRRVEMQNDLRICQRNTKKKLNWRMLQSSAA